MSDAKKRLEVAGYINSTPVTEPGVYDISNQNYHSGPGVSSSDLKELLKSGAHYQAYKACPVVPTPEMIFGSLVHALILEPEKESELIYVAKYKKRLGKEWDAAKEEGAGKLIVKQEDYDRAQELVTAFFQQAETHPCLNGEKTNLLAGVKERSFFWKDKKTGVLCKARPDNITPDGIIVDIKTTSSPATIDSFQAAIVKGMYHLSAAFYLRGVNEAGSAELLTSMPKHFAIIAIETKPPYLVQTFYLDTQSLNVGNAQVDEALKTYSQCSQTGIWTGYKQEMVKISLPNWFYYKYGMNGE